MQTFVSIVESGSLSAASAVMRTSQPTVTRRLQALERYLGLTLVQRSTHELALTESGRHVFAHAKGFLATWQSSIDAMRGAPGTARERLRVAVPSAYGHGRLLAVLADYLARCPQVAVEWVSCDGEPCFATGGLDCAIDLGGRDVPGHARVHLASEPRVVVSAPNLWGPGAPPRGPEALEAMTWILPRGSACADMAWTHEQSSEVVRLPIHPRLLTDSLCAARSAALNRLGVCLVSQWIVSDDLRAGRLVHLAPEWQVSPLPVSLVYPRASVPPPRLQTFIDLVAGQAPRLTDVFPAHAA